jgi:hypothetical protein
MIPPIKLATNTKTRRLEPTVPSQTTLHNLLTKELCSGLLNLLLDKAVLMLNRLRLVNSNKSKTINHILLALAVQATITVGSDKVFDRLGIIRVVDDDLVVVIRFVGGLCNICDIDFGTFGVSLGDNSLEVLEDSALLDGSRSAVLLSIFVLDLLVLALEDAGAAETDWASHDRVNLEGTGVGSLETESAGLWRVEDDGGAGHTT